MFGLSVPLLYAVVFIFIKHLFPINSELNLKKGLMAVLLNEYDMQPSHVESMSF